MSDPISIDLSTYVRVGRYDLPDPSNTTPPDHTSLLANEASSVTYDWDTNTLFVVGDGGTSVVQVSLTGQLINSMTLAPGSSPQGTTFYDTEGITYVGNGQFVMTEERDRQLVLFTYTAGNTLTRDQTETVKLGTTIGNIGMEGVTYDPSTSGADVHTDGGFIVVKEKTPEGIFQTNVNFDDHTATNGSPTTDNPTNLFDPAKVGTTDFSDVFALSNLSTINAAQSSHLLIISQESGKVVEVDRAGNVVSSLTIHADAGSPLSVPDMTMEGVTMGPDGTLYIVNEAGGGDSNHPQLWVYQHSDATNQAPTAVALTHQVDSIGQNTDTTARVKVADIAITDDGLGTNTLSLSGADAASFEVDSTGLYLKAGTALDAATKPNYAVTVNVDDTTVGTTPDASTNFNLAVTTATGGTPHVIISEVAPWSSGNSPLGADWFELTNTGTADLDITGWKMDDNSASAGSAVALNGITTIHAGESVIFIETSDLASATTSFNNLWFGGHGPAIQIGNYSGSGVGLSTGGDQVNIFDASDTLQASVAFGTSPTASPFQTFDNSAGVNGTSTPLTALSSVAHGGIAASEDAHEIGSPGSLEDNQAPTAVALNNQVNSIAENTSTATRIKVADIAITDDGQGTNNLSVSGTDAAFFEVDSTGLYIKAGTVLDFETKNSYAVTVNVDDPTVGGTPDASTNFNLSVSDVAEGAPHLVISEVAPWSSSSAVAADWFEVTNTGNADADVTGWKMDDNSNSFGSAVALSGVTTIHAGESVIFVETTGSTLTAVSTAFINTWFGGHAPAGLQIGGYGGSGVGLGTSGDAVNLFNASGVLQANVSFGSSTTNVTFDNAAGLNNTAISTLSQAGTNGADHAAGDTNEIGSPGAIANPAPVNHAPTAVALNNQVNSIAENTSTSTHIKVADVAVTDDGLGTNNLSLSGADAAFFEVDSTGLYIKAGTVLDFETKNSYAVTVNVDDPTVGGTPDASTNFNLGVTDVVEGAPHLVISEVAPWSSSSVVGADWFEVTNTGNADADVTGWKMDDNSNSFGSAVALSGITTIHAGESVIFVETTGSTLTAVSTAFINTWFGGNAPAGFQIGGYGGSGVGLGTSGDAVNLFNASGVLQANVSFGASTTNVTFDNTAGLNNTTISTLSQAGTNGATHAPGDANEIGSPGNIDHAPTAVALNNQVNSIAENTSTATHIKVADIAVTDDGLGTNNLSLSGADASSFEIVGSQLFVKAGTSLDFETKNSYAVTVNVDDPAVGAAPDASFNFNLSVTDVPEAKVVISEVAPWSSSSVVGQDWFEVTNTSAVDANIAGWKMDDNSNSFGSAVPLSGITTIHAGESVIFIEVPAGGNAAAITQAFINTWFGGTAPAGFQIGTYSGSGVGLGTSGDAVNLYDAGGHLQANVSFGASTTNVTFDNTAGLDNTTISQLSVAGTNGAVHAPGDTNEIGSPGHIDHAPTAVTLDNTLASIDENTPTPNHIFVADIHVTDDGLGSNTLGLTGADAAFFEIVGTQLFLKAGTVLDFEAKASYAVAVTADDPSVGSTPDATSTTYTLNVGDVNGSSIIGTTGADLIDATHTVAGQGLPSEEADHINGRGGNDTISSLGGNDVIDGGTGADTMSGGTGDDRYHVDNAGDHVIELAGQGTDTVFTTVSYALEAGSEVERLRADAGSSGISLTGNEFNNVIVGGAGDDTIAGGAGKDVLTGGAGHDTFVFTALTDSVAGAARDRIADFVEGTDHIDLSAIDAIAGTAGDDGFHFVGSGALHHAGDLSVTTAGGNTLVSADVNGDHKADFQILLSGVHTLTANDFIL